MFNKNNPNPEVFPDWDFLTCADASLNIHRQSGQADFISQFHYSIPQFFYSSIFPLFHPSILPFFQKANIWGNSCQTVLIKSQTYNTLTSCVI